MNRYAAIILAGVTMLVTPEAFSIDEIKANAILTEIRQNIESIDRISLKEFQKNTKEENSDLTDQTFQNQCFLDEMDYVELEHDLISKWKNSWQAGNVDSFMQLSSSDFVTGSFNFPEGAAWRATDSILEYKWQPLNSVSLNSKNEQNKTFENYIGQFKAIDNIDFETLNVLIDRKSRSDSDMRFNEAKLLVRFDIRGTTLKNERRNDRGTLAVTVKKEQNDWKISRLLVKDGETLIAQRKPSFSDITQESNLLNAPQYLRREAIRRGGYALAVGDYNSDGNIDLYMGAHGAGTLWKGLGDGKFEIDKNSGLGNDTLVKASIFADFDNDGDQDLILTRFTPAEAFNDIVYYENNGSGKFSKVDDGITGRTPSYYAMPAAVADFNNDKFLDFYVGFPGAKDFTVLDNIPDTELKNVQGLFYNNKHGNFTEVTKKAIPERDVQALFPHSAVALDYDQDGDMDIVVIDDRNNLSPVYQNIGDGKFMQVADSIGVSNFGYGMNVSAGDINNDGLVDLLMTNVEFVSDKRLANSCLTNWDLPLSDQLKARGLRAFRNEGNGKFSEITDAANLSWAGEATVGIEFIDYNNDGLQDIYVANGLWSGTDKDEDISSLFARSVLGDKVQSKDEIGRWPYRFGRDANQTYSDEETAKQYDASDPQSAFMKVLIGYKGGIFNKSKTDAKLSMGGFQRNRLFRNNGNGTFTEVGYLEGIDVVADGYVVAKADIDNDGLVDLVLRNGDPGTSENTFPALQVFKNNYQSKNKSITISLEATNSNHDSIGAFAIAWQSGKPQVQHLLANNGASQSQRILHFGLKDEEKLDRLVIHWPSGKIQEAKNLQAGFVHIKEAESGNIPIVSASNLIKH